MEWGLLGNKFLGLLSESEAVRDDNKSFSLTNALVISYLKEREHCGKWRKLLFPIFSDVSLGEKKHDTCIYTHVHKDMNTAFIMGFYHNSLPNDKI